MENIEKVKERIKGKTSKKKIVNNVITKFLLSVILVFLTLIFVNYGENNKNLFQTYFLNKTLSFTKINALYEKYFGQVLPSKVATVLVNNNNDLYFDYENYNDGVKFNVTKGSAINIICGGIVVFVGEKDIYKNVVIIQGVDGNDYWYGNVTNVNVTLYDYLEKNSIIGEAASEEIYLVIKNKDGYVKYQS